MPGSFCLAAGTVQWPLESSLSKKQVDLPLRMKPNGEFSFRMCYIKIFVFDPFLTQTMDLLDLFYNSTLI